MKFSISQSDLNNALQTVQRAVSTKNVLPILTGILIESTNKYIDIYSTDLEMSIMYRLSIQSDGLEKAVLPARLLSDIIRNLPEEKIEVDISNKDGIAKIKTGSAVFEMRIMPAEDFPAFPDLETEKSLTLDGNTFSSGIKQVIKAVSKDETRPVLCGVLINITNGLMNMVATDSYRLAVHEVIVGSSPELDMNIIVPARCLDEVSKLCPGKSLTIGMAKNQVYFHLGNIIIVSRVIEGTFPPYQQLLPETHETQIGLNKDEFISALKRVSIMSQNNALVRIKAEENTINIKANTVDIGEAEENIHAEITGTPMEIALNAHYMIDGLTSMTADKVVMELNNPLKPGIVKPVEGKEFLYLIMPVRIS